MVYFEQHIIIPPDVLKLLETFSTQINTFLQHTDTIINSLDPVQLSSLSNQIEKSLRTLDELPSYIRVLDKDVEAVVRVVDRFSDGLEMLAKVGIWILVALVVLVVVGCVLIKGMWNMSEEENRWIRKEILKKRGEVEGR
jgi:hypothetical protein